MDRPQFQFDDWLYVRQDKGPEGPARARYFFNATDDARVEETEAGYRVWARDCHPGCANQP